MLNLQSSLRRGEEVVAKVMDGEAIVINLANGMYYSMDKVGGAIWALLDEGHCLADIAGAVVALYDVAPAQAQADVERIVNELLTENLVTVIEDRPRPRANPDSAPQPKLAYESPTLNIYRDMGDLLALDPPVPNLGNTPWKAPTEE